MRRRPQSVLDVGCGEGWLSRALTGKGVSVIGVDAVPELIERANAAGGGEFKVASYEEIAAGTLDVKVDVVVANFALIGNEAVEGLMPAIPDMLNPEGAFIIQTLNPLVAGGDAPYQDGWRKGSWTGFGEEFTDPAPWYFRTTESWIRLINKSGMRLADLAEPLDSRTGKPASLILVAEPLK